MTAVNLYKILNKLTATTKGVVCIGGVGGLRKKKGLHLRGYKKIKKAQKPKKVKKQM